MSDTKLREAERRWKEAGSTESEAAFLLERVRVGNLACERLEVAAYCGQEAARQAVGAVGASDQLCATAWRLGFEHMKIARWGKSVGIQIAVSAIRAVMRTLAHGDAETEATLSRAAGESGRASAHVVNESVEPVWLARLRKAAGDVAQIAETDFPDWEKRLGKVMMRMGMDVFDALREANQWDDWSERLWNRPDEPASEYDILISAIVDCACADLRTWALARRERI